MSIKGRGESGWLRRREGRSGGGGEGSLWRRDGRKRGSYVVEEIENEKEEVSYMREEVETYGGRGGGVMVKERRGMVEEVEGEHEWEESEEMREVHDKGLRKRKTSKGGSGARWMRRGSEKKDEHDTIHVNLGNKLLPLSPSSVHHWPVNNQATPLFSTRAACD